MPTPLFYAKLLRYPALTVMGKFRFSEIGIFVVSRTGKCPVANRRMRDQRYSIGLAFGELLLLCSGEYDGVRFPKGALKVRPKMGRMMANAKAAVLAGIAVLLILSAVPAAGFQADQTQTASRKVKLSAPPDYPELAKKMNLHGVARVLLTVAPEGKVVTVKELGGHPVLVAALVDAVKKWRYEAADRESLIEVKFEFK